MAYSRPTLLRVPLSSVMEWVDKKSLAEIIRDDPRFETKKLPSDRSANELAVNIYFAWKPDSLQLTDTVDNEEEKPQPVVTHKKARKSGDGKGGRGWEDREAASPSLHRSENKPRGLEPGNRRSWKMRKGWW